MAYAETSYSKRIKVCMNQTPQANYGSEVHPLGRFIVFCWDLMKRARERFSIFFSCQFPVQFAESKVHARSCSDAKRHQRISKFRVIPAVQSELLLPSKFRSSYPPKHSLLRGSCFQISKESPTSSFSSNPSTTVAQIERQHDMSPCHAWSPSDQSQPKSSSLRV